MRRILILALFCACANRAGPDQGQAPILARIAVVSLVSSCPLAVRSMITPVCQLARAPGLVPSEGRGNEPASTRSRPLPTAEAKSFVIRTITPGTFPAARRSFAPHRRGHLVGVAVFSQPASNAVPTKGQHGPAKGRSNWASSFLDSVPSNGETWFLARTFAALRKGSGRGRILG